MAKCKECNKEFGLFESKNKLKDGSVMCSECYNKWDNKQKEKNEKLRREKVKKALEKNTQWEYKVVQVDTKRSGLVATDAKIEDIDQTLNGLGEEGWELVSAIGLQAVSGGLGMSSPGTTTNVAFIFKRRL